MQTQPSTTWSVHPFTSKTINHVFHQLTGVLEWSYHSTHIGDGTKRLVEVTFRTNPTNPPYDNISDPDEYSRVVALVLAAPELLAMVTDFITDSESLDKSPHLLDSARALLSRLASPPSALPLQ